MVNRLIPAVDKVRLVTKLLRLHTPAWLKCLFVTAICGAFLLVLGATNQPTIEQFTANQSKIGVINFKVGSKGTTSSYTLDGWTMTCEISAFQSERYCLGFSDFKNRKALVHTAEFNLLFFKTNLVLSIETVDAGPYFRWSRSAQEAKGACWEYTKLAVLGYTFFVFMVLSLFVFSSKKLSKKVQ